MTEPTPLRIDVAPHPKAIDLAIAQLPLTDYTTTLVVNGGTVDEPGWPTTAVRAALRAAMIELVELPGPVIVSGGTKAGLFALLGEVIAETRFDGPVIAVAPAGRIYGGHKTTLEPHHSHALLVDAPSWGDETPALLRLVQFLSRRGPVVALIAGGGKRTLAEVRGHLAARIPVIALRGTGRTTDDLAHSPSGKGRLIIVDVRDASAVAAAVRAELRPDSRA